MYESKSFILISTTVQNQDINKKLEFWKELMFIIIKVVIFINLLANTEKNNEFINQNITNITRGVVA